MTQSRPVLPLECAAKVSPSEFRWRKTAMVAVLAAVDCWTGCQTHRGAPLDHDAPIIAENAYDGMSEFL